MAEKETKMSEAKLQKAAQIEEIKEKIGKCGAFVVVDYKGISVADDTKLRSDFRKNDVEYRVLKNRLVLRALSELNIGGFEGHLEGPTAIAFAYGDPLAASRPKRYCSRSCSVCFKAPSADSRGRFSRSRKRINNHQNNAIYGGNQQWQISQR